MLNKRRDVAAITRDMTNVLQDVTAQLKSTWSDFLDSNDANGQDEANTSRFHSRDLKMSRLIRKAESVVREAKGN